MSFVIGHFAPADGSTGLLNPGVHVPVCWHASPGGKEEEEDLDALLAAIDGPKQAAAAPGATDQAAAPAAAEKAPAKEEAKEGDDDEGDGGSHICMEGLQVEGATCYWLTVCGVVVHLWHWKVLLILDDPDLHFVDPPMI
jgi:hypothetical protein